MKMVEAGQRLAVFNSLHRVMRAEAELGGAFDILLIPVPGAISADCGMVLRYQEQDEAAIVARLQELKLGPFSLYRPCAQGYEKTGELS